MSVRLVIWTEPPVRSHLTNIFLGLACLVMGGLTGCATFHRSADLAACATPQPQIERGKPHACLDGVGWVIGIPGKVLLWNCRVDNHHISEKTEAEIEQYLACTGLPDTKVRLNQYDPRGEWQRLRSNDQIAPGWRYTAGVWHWLGYTILPGRVFGGDWYNPYTNTVNVYSDVPSIAIEETAYAVDVAGRKHPGTYAFVQGLPLVNMWHHTIATDRAIAYEQTTGDAEGLKEAYQVLYPRYGLLAGQGTGYFLGATALFEVGGALAGHAAGRYEGSRISLPEPESTVTAIFAD
ncbi:hypothetical protein [Planctomicrobium piriforme]|uniref:Uncharacterized protein n=1 Tax=Planctomicrobium piriforme TaxID=1576369 RepID=A0A1I3D0K3_9PLAN|nr:hypothetical protein [Planctomicrobium piriforme]SFH80300.1 hypothetical protein SAMN05421753_10343 [Planctomicrobium piriforme]